MEDPVNADATQSLVKREVWLLNKCSLCGYFPLVQTERDGFGKRWHVHDVIAATAAAIAQHEQKED